ncbi:MAG: glycosyltransferase family 39 protein [Patescibacteria group bacterium]
MKNHTKYLILIITIVFCLSLAHSFVFKIRPAVDARAYNTIAENIVKGNGYKEDANAPMEKDVSIIRVGPGYELFLAGVYRAFGFHYEVVWVFQAIFQSLIALFVFLISRQILKNNWSPIIGLSASALIGFSPDLIVASSMLLTENLAIFLLIGCLYFFFRYWDGGNWIDIILFSIIFSFSILARSQFIFLSPLFLVFFFTRKQWIKMAVFCAIILIVFSPWVIRNYKIYNEFIPFNAAMGYNLWDGNHMGASGEMEIDYQPLINYAETHTPVETHQKGIEEFKGFLIEHPVEFAKLTLKRISIFFSLSRPTGFWPDFSGLQKIITAGLSLIYSVFLFSLSLAGIVILFKNNQIKKEKKLMFFLCLTILIPLSVAFILVETRYRYPIYPFLAVFSGITIANIISDKKNIKILGLSFIFLLANAFGDFIFNFEKFYNNLKNLL